MSRDWESTFRSWKEPLSDTAEQKCQNAERMIKDAIAKSDAFVGKKIKVFTQGSYQNNTNVKFDSDVDVCVCLMDSFFYDLSVIKGITKEDVGIEDAKYLFSDFRNDVESALIDKFGKKGITRGKKAFDIHENTYRVDADVVACLEHRRYTHKNSYGEYQYISGTEFFSDDNSRIVNWPKQHFENGVQKNNDTNQRFKYMVRVFKRLRNDMMDNNISSAKSIPSFLIESLIWNVPNEIFGNSNYCDDVRNIIRYLHLSTMKDESCHEWREISELKYLFRITQPWKRNEVNTFLAEAWSYAELGE